MPRVKTPEASRLRVARNVKALRTVLGLSQAALGQRAGLHRTYIVSIEQAARNLSLDNLDRLALALGVDAQDLLSRQ